MDLLMIGIVFSILLLLGIGLLAISFTVKVEPQQILIVATSKEQTPIVYRNGRKFLLPMYHRYAVFSLEPMEFKLRSRTKAHSGELVDSNISIGIHFSDDQNFTQDVLFNLVELQQRRLEEVVRGTLMRGIQQTIQSREYVSTYQHQFDLFMGHLINCCRHELQENGLKILRIQILNLSPTIEENHAVQETSSLVSAPMKRRMDSRMEVSVAGEEGLENDLKQIKKEARFETEADFVGIEPMILNFHFQDIPDKGNVPLTIPVKLVVGMGEEPPLPDTAARELTGLSDAEIEAKTRTVIEERFPKAIRSMTITDINRSREWFYQGLVHEINSGLHNYGLRMINITVSDITDSAGIIEGMRAKALEEYRSQRRNQ